VVGFPAYQFVAVPYMSPLPKHRNTRNYTLRKVIAAVGKVIAAVNSVNILQAHGVACTV
jgi:hypothetical protein